MLSLVLLFLPPVSITSCSQPFPDCIFNVTDGNFGFSFPDCSWKWIQHKIYSYWRMMNSYWQTMSVIHFHRQKKKIKWKLLETNSSFKWLNLAKCWSDEMLKAWPQVATYIFKTSCLRLKCQTFQLNRFISALSQILFKLQLCWLQKKKKTWFLSTPVSQGQR